VGLQWTDDGERLVAVTRGGSVRVFRRDEDAKFLEAGGGAAVHAPLDSVADLEIPAARGDGSGFLSAAEFAGDVVAAGGRSVDVRLFDVAAGKETWRARNVPNNHLDQPYAVWPR